MCGSSAKGGRSSVVNEKRYMREAFRRTLLFVSFIGALVFARELAAQSGTPKPRAVAPETTFEFGSVSQGVKVVHEFTLRNEGTAPFSIQRVVPSCGCTASAANTTTVTPGGEAKIRVEFDTTGFSGERTKSVRVLTSDSERPSIDLLLKGTIFPDVVADPAYIAFGDVFPGTDNPLAKTVTVTVRDGAEVSLGGAKAWSNSIVVTEIEKGSMKRVFSVSLAPNVPQGELRDRVVVMLTKGSSESALNIPVVASVKAEVVVKPSTISFGVIEGDTIMTRKATLNNFGIRPVRVTDITSSDPALSAAATPIDGGKAFILNLSLDPKKVKGDFRGVLSIITDRQDIPPVALQVYGIVPPRVE